MNSDKQNWKEEFEKYFSLNQIRTKETRELLLLVKHWIGENIIIEKNKEIERLRAVIEELKKFVELENK